MALPVLSQVTLDSARAYYAGNWVTELWGRASFSETPSADEYDIGFQDETDMLAFTLRWLGK